MFTRGKIVLSLANPLQKLLLPLLYTTTISSHNVNVLAPSCPQPLSLPHSCSHHCHSDLASPSPLAHHDPHRCQCLSSTTLTLSHMPMLATSCPLLLLPLAHCRYPISSAGAASCPQLSSLTQLLSTPATTHVLTHPPPSNLSLELHHCHLSSADVALSLRC